MTRASRLAPSSNGITVPPVPPKPNLKTPSMSIKGVRSAVSYVGAAFAYAKATDFDDKPRAVADETDHPLHTRMLTKQVFVPG